MVDSTAALSVVEWVGQRVVLTADQWVAWKADLWASTVY